jgi:branched-chain amino acid transport system ATP-binding protein
MLKVNDLAVYYGRIRALYDVTLEIQQGDTRTLIGANGAGKSTLLNAIIGLLKPVKGTVEFLGEPIHELHADAVARRGIALVPEGRMLFGRMTVLENLLMGSFTIKNNRKEISRRIESNCAKFPILAKRRGQLAGTLSGGEQQMVAIARALMSSPKLLLLDEPSAGLAPIVVNEVFNTIKKIRDDGSTIILVEQNASKALSVASWGYVLELGKIVIEGTPDKLQKNEMVRSSYIGV